VIYQNSGIERSINKSRTLCRAEIYVYRNSTTAMTAVKIKSTK